MTRPLGAEAARVADNPGELDPWRRWGPYVSGRQWGTVREDYSDDGDAWRHFPWDHSHMRAYRWGEDGIAGLCDRYGFLNLALAVWNGADDRLKERYFGLANEEGNHGEDVKEYWWALDATPTHSYAEYLYRYPQAAFPYTALRHVNAARSRDDVEYELLDTGVLDGDRFFDISVTHAKADAGEIVIEIAATNHGPDPAPLDLVPQWWFRNTWSWGRDDRRPGITVVSGASPVVLEAQHDWLGRVRLIADGTPDVLRCDNETNLVACFGVDPDNPDQPAHPKDAINNAIVHGDNAGLFPADENVSAATGLPATKAALRWHFDAVHPGDTVTVRMRMVEMRDNNDDNDGDNDGEAAGASTLGEPESLIAQRKAEADEFYQAVIPADAGPEDAFIARRAFAGLLWGKQLYRYDIREWLAGDPGQPPPPPERLTARNHTWKSLSLADIISMPDEWEYPWFATWDLAFHCVAMAHIDPAFAKAQLNLLCREWAMNADGQLPAYEWDFSDVNPPVHAWAAWYVYQLDGGWDREFLIRIFTKLLFNVGWWVNRKDVDGSNLFEGGFLGMDNIGPFDRSKPLPDHLRLEQSDATSWIAFSFLSMLRIALELARDDVGFDGTATKFLEHFLSIAEAMDSFGTGGVSLWDEDDNFFYDTVVAPDGQTAPVRVRSLVGLLPMLAVGIAPDWVADQLPDFTNRLRWLQRRRPELTDAVVFEQHDDEVVTTLAAVRPSRLVALLGSMLDENEFLSPHGIRSLSARYRGGVDIDIFGTTLNMTYSPAESTSFLFGGNSNWRGPVWFPINVLLADALRLYGRGIASDTMVEMPTGSGQMTSLADVADNLDDRLIALFRIGPDGRRPSDAKSIPTSPLWQAHPTFSEYFNGDDGSGLGASHQTGWTALVAHLICTTRGKRTEEPAVPPSPTPPGGRS